MESMNSQDRKLLKETHETVNKLHMSIVGNEDLKIKGIAVKVDENCSKIESLEKSRSRSKWIMAGIGTGGSVIGGFLGGSKWLAALLKIIGIF